MPVQVILRQRQSRSFSIAIYGGLYLNVEALIVHANGSKYYQAPLLDHINMTNGIAFHVYNPQPQI